MTQKELGCQTIGKGLAVPTTSKGHSRSKTNPTKAGNSGVKISQKKIEGVRKGAELVNKGNHK